MKKFQADLQRVQEYLSDAARIGSREVLLTVDRAKRQIERMQFVQRRKDLFAEIGRSLYDAYKDGMPNEVKHYIQNTEFVEIFQEISDLDDELEKRGDEKR